MPLSAAHGQWHGGRRNSTAEPQAHSQSSFQPKKEKAILIAALPISVLPCMGPLLATALLGWTRSGHAWSTTTARLHIGATILLLLGAIVLSIVFMLQIWKIRSEDGNSSSVFSSTPGLIVVGLQYGLCMPVSWIFQGLAWKEYRKLGDRRNHGSTQRNDVELDRLPPASSEEDPSDYAPRRSSSRSSRHRGSVGDNRNEEEASSSGVESPDRGSLWERRGRRGGDQAVCHSNTLRGSSTTNLVEDAQGSGRVRTPSPTHQNRRYSSDSELSGNDRRQNPARFV
ncbi:hypothetical protein JCM5353_000481 [Sporobolomyces roseus]